MTTRSGLLALQEALRALERSGRAARRSRGLPDSRSEAAREAGGDGLGGRLDARRISSWLDPEQGRAPRDADQVWALVRVWAQWAGDRTQRRAYWNKLVEDAQPTRVQPAGTPAGSPLLGRVVATLTDEDALGLEVHPAIEGGAGPLPPYLPRPHDLALRDELRAAGEHGGLVVLVGGSSIGKTRACWEAVRAMLPDWRLWHPLAPTRSEALIAALADERLGPRTVGWLNDAWQYLGIDAAGERAASALHALLQRGADAPVLVLGSMWPDQWDRLSRAGTDRPAAAALLRLARLIPVPAVFTARQLDLLQAAWEADSRLRLAVRLSGGRVTQFLAGAPELEARYRQADEAVQAVVHAAVDARRLGHTAPLPGPFLRDAAAACLPEDVWAQVEADWFDAALDYLARPCRGVPGILIEHRPRTGELSSGRADYRLADYIEQVGRRERGPTFPPAGFWEAAARTVADADMLGQLAEGAVSRLRYRVAARMLYKAAQQGSTSAYARLAQLCCAWRDYDGAEVMANRAAEEQHATVALCHVAAASAAAGDTARAARLYERAADLGDSDALKELSRLWARVGEPEKAEAVTRAAARSGAAWASSASAGRRGDAAPSDTADLWRAGHHGLAEAAAHDADDNGRMLSLLAEAAVEESDAETAERLYRASAARGGSYALRDLMDALWRFGDRAGAEAAARDAAVAGNVYPLRGLADQLYRAGDRQGAERLYRELVERGDAVARSLLAQMNVDAIDPEAAAEAARNGDCVELRALADRALLSGDYDLAEQFYSALMGDDPGDALFHIAVARARGDDLAGAEDVARTAAEHGDEHALMFVADQANLRGDVRTAERLGREHNDRAGATDPERIAQHLPEAQAEQLRRYGLEPDGGLSPSWSCAGLPPT